MLTNCHEEDCPIPQNNCLRSKKRFAKTWPGRTLAIALSALFPVISFTKYIESSSAPLILSCCNGAHFDSAWLTVRKAGGEKPVDYVTINMQEVLITSVSTGGCGSDDRLTEYVSLNFAKVKVEYLPQEAKGGKGNMIPFSWDIAANDDQV